MNFNEQEDFLLTTPIIIGPSSACPVRPLFTGVTLLEKVTKAHSFWDLRKLQNDFNQTLEGIVLEVDDYSPTIQKTR